MRICLSELDGQLGFQHLLLELGSLRCETGELDLGTNCSFSPSSFVL